MINSTIMNNLIFSGGKRSVEVDEEEHSAPVNPLPEPEPEPLKESPIPFDMSLHGHRYRRQCLCTNQYVLFLLDTSGSIGQSTFCRVTCLLGDLVQWFCNSVRVATMTFSHAFHKEFCFDDYNNDCIGRDGARSAMRNIGYRRGGTHTGEAINCAFIEMLMNPSCGFSQNWECLSIVFITDGRSNGPLNTCDEVNRLRATFADVTTYAIGIGGGVNEAELRCLASNPDADHLLQYPNFDAFIEGLSTVHGVLKLESMQLGNSAFACANVHGLFGSSTCPLQESQC